MLGFYSANKANSPIDVKFRSKKKFEWKVLIWLTLSDKGISQPFISTSKGFAINSDVYVPKYLPKLFAFIRKYHDQDNYVFWPDLASSHYSKVSIEWLQQHNIPFVPKAVNPPNVPKARPIEDFWSILADKVYNGGWTPTNHQELINRIKQQFQTIDFKVVENMMKSIRTKLRKIEDQGRFSIL